MAHPTPAQIKHALYSKLNADFDDAERRGLSPIPARVWRLVDEAISEANKEAGNGPA